MRDCTQIFSEGQITHIYFSSLVICLQFPVKPLKKALIKKEKKKRK